MRGFHGSPILLNHAYGPVALVENVVLCWEGLGKKSVWREEIVKQLIFPAAWLFKVSSMDFLIHRHHNCPGGRAGGALEGLAGAMLTLQSAASEELLATQATGACRQLEWDAGASPCRSDSASSTQPCPPRASRAGLGSCRDSGGGAAVPEPTTVQGVVQGERDGDAARSDSEESARQGRGNHTFQQIPAQQAYQTEHGPNAGKHAQHEPGMSGLLAEDQASQVSLEGSACQSDRSLPGKSSLLKQKLFDALRGAPDGPIELDPAMLYSPASSLQPPSSSSEAPEQARSADGSAARRTLEQPRSATAPR